MYDIHYLQGKTLQQLISCSYLFLLVVPSVENEPGKAIDGIIHDADYGFYHSLGQSTSDWLQINMGKEETVCKVQLYSRTDLGPPHANRREHIEVRVGNIQASSDLTGNPLCDITKPHPTTFQTTLRCATPLTGMFIVMRRAVNNYWAIAEVFAYSL